MKKNIVVNKNLFLGFLIGFITCIILTCLFFRLSFSITSQVIKLYSNLNFNIMIYIYTFVVSFNSISLLIYFLSYKFLKKKIYSKYLLITFSLYIATIPYFINILVRDILDVFNIFSCIPILIATITIVGLINYIKRKNKSSYILLIIFFSLNILYFIFPNGNIILFSINIIVLYRFCRYRKNNNIILNKVEKPQS